VTLKGDVPDTRTSGAPGTDNEGDGSAGDAGAGSLPPDPPQALEIADASNSIVTEARAPAIGPIMGAGAKSSQGMQAQDR
jgi:hypothetical protein